MNYAGVNCNATQEGIIKLPVPAGMQLHNTCLLHLRAFNDMMLKHKKKLKTFYFHYLPPTSIFDQTNDSLNRISDKLPSNTTMVAIFIIQDGKCGSIRSFFYEIH